MKGKICFPFQSVADKQYALGEALKEVRSDEKVAGFFFFLEQSQKTNQRNSEQVIWYIVKLAPCKC